jgi:hypothetical protein
MSGHFYKISFSLKQAVKAKKAKRANRAKRFRVFASFALFAFIASLVSRPLTLIQEKAPGNQRAQDNYFGSRNFHSRLRHFNGERHQAVRCPTS